MKLRRDEVQAGINYLNQQTPNNKIILCLLKLRYTDIKLSAIS